MSIEIKYEYTCDRCGCTLLTGIKDLPMHHGWITTGKYKLKHYCSEKCKQGRTI